MFPIPVEFEDGVYKPDSLPKAGERILWYNYGTGEWRKGVYEPLQSDDAPPSDEPGWFRVDDIPSGCELHDGGEPWGDNITDVLCWMPEPPEPPDCYYWDSEKEVLQYADYVLKSQSEKEDK